MEARACWQSCGICCRPHVKTDDDLFGTPHPTTESMVTAAIPSGLTRMTRKIGNLSG